MPLVTRREFVYRGAIAGCAGAIAARALQAPPAPTQTGGSSADRIAAMRQAGATTPIQVTKLRDTIFMLQGAGGNMVVQIGPDGKLLIDSSFATAAPRITQALSKLDAHPLKLLINTHWHFDHTDGNAAMHDNGAFIIAQTNTRARLSQPQYVKALDLHFQPAATSGLPQQTFDTQEKLYYNNDQVELVYFPNAHTDSDIYIFFSNGNVLHTGDLWFNGTYPFIDDSTGGNINGMIRAADQLLTVADDKAKIVPGHGPLGNKSQLASYRDMLATVATRVEKLKSSGQTLQQAVASKPTADLDPVWNKGGIGADLFVTIVYNTLP